MSASLVGSEMCIRDSPRAPEREWPPGAPAWVGLTPEQSPRGQHESGDQDPAFQSWVEDALDRAR
eukprot:11392392-Alexandrium_andersonii.AAC.1